jgi:hypothetical protein
VRIKEIPAFNRLFRTKDLNGENLGQLADYLQNELPLSNSYDRCHHNQGQLRIKITAKS